MPGRIAPSDAGGRLAEGENEARWPTFQRQCSRQRSPSPFQSHRRCWAGIRILAASVNVGDILFRAARRDRLARRQLARYDGTLDDLLEPK